MSILFLPIFENEVQTTSIVATSVAVIGAIVLFLLVRIMTFLKTSGSLSGEIHCFYELSTKDMRLQVKFFNATNKDVVYSSFGLYKAHGNSYELVLPLELNPIETGGSHARWDYATKALDLPAGASYFAIFLYSSNVSFEEGKYALGYFENGKKTRFLPFQW